MLGRSLLVALLIGLGIGGPAWAGPFDQVPGSNRAYGDGAYLAQRGLIKPPLGGEFSSRQPLTRTDFALALLPVAQALSGQDAPSPHPWLNALLARLPPEEARQVAARMARLLAQFRPELRLMGHDANAAVAEAKRLAATPPTAPPRPGRADGNQPRETPVGSRTLGAAGLRYELSGAELGVTYRRMSPDRAPLAYLPTWAPARPLERPAQSRLAPVPEKRAYASRELTVRSLRGSLEYDVTRSLTVSLAYEALAREGYGLTALGDSSLKTVGLGYRLSPSALVRLRYHLIDYPERLASTVRQHDELAETELVIRF